MEKKIENDVKLRKRAWQNKEYRSFPVLVLKHLRRDQNLSGNAIVCWQTLFEFAFFDERWSIEITRKELAQELNKSLSTIDRLLAELEAGGYIERQIIKEKWGIVGTQIFITLPKELDHKLLSAPDRKRSSNVISLPERNQKEKRVVNEHNGSKTGHFGALSNMFHVEHLEPHDNQSLEKPEKRNETETKRGRQKLKEGIVKSDGSLYKKNINNNINNNSVVDIDKKEGIKLGVNKLNQEIREKDSLLAKNKNNGETFKILQQIGELENRKRFLEQELTEQTKRAVTEKSNNSLSYVTKPGEREIPPDLLKILEKSISYLESDRGEQCRLINEIACAVRFGELRISYRDKKPMTVRHAVNVALKLVREKRWETPKGMQYAA